MPRRLRLLAMTIFAELTASTHYSFLRGASSPADMLMQAMSLGMTGIGIADRNSVAGVVRAHAALRRAHEEAAEEGLVLPGFKLIVGSRLVFADDTPEVIVYPRNRRGWGRLTRLLSTGNLRAEKGDCFLYAADLLERCDEDWALIILPEASASGRGTVSQSAAAADGGGAGGGSAGSGIPLHHPSDGPPPPAARGEEISLRIGFRQIDGFRETWAEQIIAARPFKTIEELAHKAKLPARALRLLADADACRSLGLDRRQALWEVRRTPVNTLPLFEAAQTRELGEEQDAHLPAMTKGEQVVADYQSVRLSLKGHPMEFLRERFRAMGVLSCAELATAKNGSQAKVAGVVLIRQRPGKGNAVFITLEDESGVSNLLLWASRFEKMRRPVMAARLMLATGEVQRSVEGVTHLMTSRVEDYTFMLDEISAHDGPNMPMARADEVNRPVYRNEDRQAARAEREAAQPRPAYPRHGHPRNVRILPKSRDFH